MTRISASGTHAGVKVRRTFEDGATIDRNTVFEGGSWKHRMVDRELIFFMPNATHERFLEAR